MINKQVNNTGSAGGHGMSIIDTNSMSAQELRHEVQHGLEAYCPHCGTRYKMDTEKFSGADSVNLMDHFAKHQCIECNPTIWKKLYAAEYQKCFVKVALDIGGRSIEAIRIPVNYKASKLKMLCDLEKEAESDNAPKQEFTTIGGKKVPITKYDAKGNRVE